VTDPYEETVAAIANMSPSKQFGAATIRVYVEALKPVPLRLLRNVVWQMVRTRVYPPTIAEVLQAVAEHKLQLPEPFAAWEMAVEAAAQGGMTRLPEPVKRAAAAVGGSWDIRTSENTVALRSHFLRAYEEFRRAAVRERVLELSSPKRKAISA